MKKLLFIILMLAVLTGCHSLRMGVGLKGEVVEEDTLVLDGDTFTIQERIGDSLFIVWNYEHSDDKTPCYLLKYERNGFYYPQIGASDITSIDNTTEYVCIDEKDVYDIKNKKVLFAPPCNASGLCYLGEWKDLFLFASSDTLCFSDGKCFGLQDDVYCRIPRKKGLLTLVAGAQTIEVPFGDLYHSRKIAESKDISVERTIKDYHIKPRNKYESMDAGFTVDLEIPKGNTGADRSIREWMMTAVRDDAFFQLEAAKIFL